MQFYHRNRNFPAYAVLLGKQSGKPVYFLVKNKFSKILAPSTLFCDFYVYLCAP